MGIICDIGLCMLPSSFPLFPFSLPVIKHELAASMNEANIKILYCRLLKKNTFTYRKIKIKLTLLRMSFFLVKIRQVLEPELWLNIVKDLLKSKDAPYTCVLQPACRNWAAYKWLLGAGPQTRFVLQISHERGHLFGYADPEISYSEDKFTLYFLEESLALPVWQPGLSSLLLEFMILKKVFSGFMQTPSYPWLWT